MSAPEELLDALTPLLVRRFRDRLYAHLQRSCPVTLRDGTYPLLTALAHEAGTATQLAERVGVDRSVATRQADVLERAGLIERTRHTSDHRNVTLSLTTDGHRAALALRQASASLIASLHDRGVTEADMRTTARTIARLTQVLDEPIPSPANQEPA